MLTETMRNIQDQYKAYLGISSSLSLTFDSCLFHAHGCVAGVHEVCSRGARKIAVGLQVRSVRSRRRAATLLIGNLHLFLQHRKTRPCLVAGLAFFVPGERLDARLQLCDLFFRRTKPFFKVLVPHPWCTDMRCTITIVNVAIVQPTVVPISVLCVA